MSSTNLSKLRTGILPTGNLLFLFGSLLSLYSFNIQNVKQTFLNEPISKITTTIMETKLQWIFEQFLNYSETYIKYI